MMLKDSLRAFFGKNNIPEDDEVYFDYSATLRIAGNIGNIDEITRLLELNPTYSHKIGERHGPRSKPFPHDMWEYSPNIPKEQPLHEHINALWSAVKNKKNELLSFKEKYSVDIFLGYRSNSDMAGIEIPYESLEIFYELKIPFGISIIIT
jgi:hypothetical protein